MFFQTLGLMLLAPVFILLLRSIMRGKVGNIIVDFIAHYNYGDRQYAMMVYQRYIRNNIEVLMLGAILILFLIFFRLSLSWFTNYFDEIVAGVNQLAKPAETPIIMSSELSFMADKLNQVQAELIRSANAEHEAEKRKNDLIVYLAHDIKTPLTSVIGYLSLLDEIPDMPTQQRAKYVHITLEKAYRLEKLINEFFEITRYNLASIPLSKELIHLNYMMIQIADEAYPQLTARGQQVSLTIPEDLSIQADSEKLARVFNNLLKNAIAYSPENELIEITGKQENNSVILRFTNCGVIPANKLETIFEKFFRLDEARQSSTGGAGLGLAIAKDIITLHGGTISASCDETHTTFTIILPNG